MIRSHRISKTIQNHFVSILGLMALCILLFLFVLPAKHRIKDTKEEVASAQEEIRSHQSAISLLENKLTSLRQNRSERRDQFQDLEAELDTLQSNLSNKIIFHLPEKGPFPDSADMLLSVLKKMADKHRLHEVIINLQEPSYTLNRPSITATITATGSLPDFRAFLVHLLETPYVTTIDELQLFSCKSGLCLDTDLTIWLDK